MTKQTIVAVVGLLVIGIVLVLFSNISLPTNQIQMSNMSNKLNTTNPIVILHTNYGEITIELFADKAPLTVENFLNLAQAGFYDNTLFHRVIHDFMIQGGDPYTREFPEDWSRHGTGGPGYLFDDEKSDIKLERGIVAMANSGPNTNGSQFFIITALVTDWLQDRHTAFGRVVGGWEVVQTIEKVKTDQNDHPLEEVKINRVEIN